MTEQGDFNETLPDATSHTGKHVIDNSRAVIIFHATIPSITLLFVLVRNYSRFCILRTPGWDDLCLNIGWVSFINLILVAKSIRASSIEQARSGSYLKLTLPYAAFYRYTGSTDVPGNQIWNGKTYTRRSTTGNGGAL
jgi:hypothetical protein